MYLNSCLPAEVVVFISDTEGMGSLNLNPKRRNIRHVSILEISFRLEFQHYHTKYTISHWLVALVTLKITFD